MTNPAVGKSETAEAQPVAAEGVARNSSAVSAAPRPGPHDSNGVHSLPMIKKLEVAAAYPQVADAITALTSWASIVGPDKAPSQFFDASCKAPEFLMKSLVENPLVLQSNPTVRSAFVALLEHLLPASRPGSSSAARVTTEIVTVLTRVSAVRASSGIRTLSPGSASSERLAHSMAAVLRSLSSVLEGARRPTAETVEVPNKPLGLLEAIAEIDNSIQRLHSEVSAASSTSGGIKQLVAVREAKHEIMELQKKVKRALFAENLL